MDYAGRVNFERKNQIISEISIDPDVNKRWFKRLYPLIREQRTSFLITFLLRYRWSHHSGISAHGYPRSHRQPSYKRFRKN